MRQLSILLIFFLARTAVNAQQIKQLTFNKIPDYQVAIYKNKIVWVNGINSYSDIFLAEKDAIEQLTFGSGYNYWPDVGSKYIIWWRTDKDHYSGASLKELIYYDGFTEKVLDQGSIIYAKTVGKYILWRKYIDFTVENYLEQYLLFDGERTQVIAESHKRNLISVLQFTENEIVFIETDTVEKVARLVSYDYIKKNIIDSVVNGLLMDAYSPYNYIKRKDGGPVFPYFYYNRNDTSTKLKLYANGKIIELQNTYDLIQNFNEDFITFLSYRGGKHKMDSSELKISRNNKLFFVSKYPFTKVEYIPELAEVTTFFGVQDTLGKFHLYVYHSGEIKLLTSTIRPYNWQNFNISGNSIAYVENKFNDFNLTEIFYYCGEDSCLNPTPVKDFKAEIYYKQQTRKIAIKIETPQQEWFQLEIFDLLGRKVAGTNFVSLYGEFTFLFPAENIQEGIYIIRLQNTSKPEEHFTQKLFIP